MKNTDKEQLAEILEQVYGLKGKEVKPATIQLWYSILEPYAMEDVSRALSQLMRTSTYLPQPSEVIDIVDPAQWPTAAEAWGIYPQDERDTGAVCEASLAAWASAEDLYHAGDVIGARRAFEGAYERHMTAAKALGIRSPRWWLSEGWDAEGRERGAREAVRLGLLKREQVAGYLLDEREERNSADRLGGVRPAGRLAAGAVADRAKGSV